MKAQRDRATRASPGSGRDRVKSLGGAAFLLALVCTAAAVTQPACSDPPPPPIQVQGNLLTVDNQTPRDWTGVEIWINRQYRITVPRIAAHTRFTTTLDVFVAGFGQRFDRGRQAIKDLRLTARDADGTPVELTLAQP